MDAQAEVRVLVVDDDFFARSDLTARLARHSQIRVVGEADSPGRALALLAAGTLEAAPDVVLLDLDYEDGDFDPARFVLPLRVQAPGVHVLGMSVREDDGAALRAVQAGIDGVAWKNELRSTVCRAILCIHTGRRVFTPGVVRDLLGRVSHLPGKVEVVCSSRQAHLTPRLEQVARLWCEAGLGAREIAEEMHLSEHTVRGYVKQIYQILGLDEHEARPGHRQQAYERRVDAPGEC